MERARDSGADAGASEPEHVETVPTIRSEAVRIPKMGEVVADQIRRQIIRGELPEGSFLPPELELMETFGISRPTLREALRVLEAERLVSLGRGSRTGARVELPRFESVARYAGFALQAAQTTMGDIYSARLEIEPRIARILAETRPEEAARRLDEKITQLLRLAEQDRNIEYTTGVAEFHSLLVTLADSKTLLMITRMLQEIVMRYQVRIIAARHNPPERQREINMTGARSFARLTKLIAAGRGEEAETHWRSHLEISNAIWLRDGLDAQVIDVFD